MLEEYNCGRNTVFVNFDVLLCFVCPETLSSFAYCLQMQSSPQHFIMQTIPYRFYSFICNYWPYECKCWLSNWSENTEETVKRFMCSYARFCIGIIFFPMIYHFSIYWIVKTILTRIISVVCVPGLLSFTVHSPQTMMMSHELTSWAGSLDLKATSNLLMTVLSALGWDDGGELGWMVKCKDDLVFNSGSIEVAKGWNISLWWILYLSILLDPSLQKNKLFLCT